MSTCKSFSDIQKIDPGLATCFKQPGDAVRWCMAIEGPVAKWIKQHANKRGSGGKTLWELVRFASVRKGVFDAKPRYKHASIMIKFCPDGFREEEKEMSFDQDKEISALVSSMEHYEFINDLNTFDTLCDSNITRLYVLEIEALLDGQELPTQAEDELPTIEERVENYLRSSYNDGETAFPRYRLHISKDYGSGITPRISLAMYQRQDFLDNDKPSTVWAYEFIDSQLTERMLYAIVGKYSQRRGLLKPYIVSPFAFDRQIISLAENHYVGLVLVNRNLYYQRRKKMV